ncbi:hypothetical protein CFAM422_003118 [Trichoderma lentiforme]|uniref:Uncharacterized protein n=1 Tax=Trichoderma lentiforme TaxID=1567552 RepID=A0A9P4XK48_9HYPO|nr:hypothetical protein CFAM422_003118 [Trichoderma lentiforme]
MPMGDGPTLGQASTALLASTTPLPNWFDGLRWWAAVDRLGGWPVAMGPATSSLREGPWR